MADAEPPEYGTWVIAILLLMALGFAGLWIMEYATPGGQPTKLYSWFGLAAVVTVVAALVVYLLPPRRGR